ncbi:hypothetical protein TNCV_1378811, partial [Trichonephila clavipes]
PWQWGNEGKREIVLNRRPSELYRGKYRCVQPKINLLKRRSYACETQCFPVELPDVEEVPSHDGAWILLLVSMEVPLRTYGQNGRYGMQPKAEVFARRRKSKPKRKLLDIRAELERKKRKRERWLRAVCRDELSGWWTCQPPEAPKVA